MFIDVLFYHSSKIPQNLGLMPVFTFDWPLKDTHFNLSVMPFNLSKIESILKRCYKYSISLITPVPRPTPILLPSTFTVFSNRTVSYFEKGMTERKPRAL